MMKAKRYSSCILLLAFLLFGYFLCAPWTLMLSTKNIMPKCTDGTNKTVMDNLWQPIGNTEEMVFSAYVDYANSSIKIIGLATLKRKKGRRYWCLLHKVCPGRNKTEVVEARVQIIPEHHSQRFSAAYFICSIARFGVPEAVSVINNKVEQSRNMLSIQEQNVLVQNFTVCVSPFNENYDNDHALVEMIELNKILGADRFVFYNHSIGLNVDRVLKFYQQKGEIDVLAWNLNHDMSSQTHYYGQMAAINDCLYRCKGRSKFMVNQDLDEFIFPLQHSTWTEMMASFPQNKGSYQFRSTVFRTDWDDVNKTFDGQPIARKVNSISLLKQRREVFIFGKNTRSKYIAVSNTVDIAGIHYVWKYEKGFQTYNVEPNVALLHHYKFWPDRKGSEIYDDRIMLYKDRLLTRLEEKWKEIRNIL